jgi:hypothetical protein
VKPNMPVFDVLDFNWLTCWVNTLESVSSLSLPKKKKKKRVSVVTILSLLLSNRASCLIK